MSYVDVKAQRIYLVDAREAVATLQCSYHRMDLPPEDIETLRGAVVTLGDLLNRAEKARKP